MRCSRRAIWDAERRAIAFAQKRGVTVVAAEGNQGDDLAHPTQDVTSPDDTTPVTRAVTNACAVVEAMCCQDVPVLVRILVLPGHNDCCHLPILTLLHPFRERILLNVMGQYAPDFVIGPGDGPLARRPRREEIAAVRNAAHAASPGLTESRGWTSAAVKPQGDAISRSCSGTSTSRRAHSA